MYRELERNRKPDGTYAFENFTWIDPAFGLPGRPLRGALPEQLHEQDPERSQRLSLALALHAGPAGCRFGRGWDLAGTAWGGDWTVGALLAVHPTRRCDGDGCCARPVSRDGCPGDDAG